MRRLAALLLIFLLPLTALSEGWVRIPSSLLPDGWLTAPISQDESILVATVDTPDGFAHLSDLCFLAVSGDEPVAEIQFTASAINATPTDLPDVFMYRAAGREVACRRDEHGLTASFMTAAGQICLWMIPTDPAAADRVLLNRLPEWISCVHPVNEISGMPLPGLAWGMDEDALIRKLGVAVYAVPLAGDDWEGLEYITSVYDAEVAELDCCMHDGRLRMLLVGLEESSEDRVLSLLTDALGTPKPANPKELSSAMKLINGHDLRFADALMWRCADANVFLTGWNGVVMVLLTDPTMN